MTLSLQSEGQNDKQSKCSLLCRPVKPSLHVGRMLPAAWIASVLIAGVLLAASVVVVTRSNAQSEGVRASFPFTYSPIVSQMLASIQEEDVAYYAGLLSGEEGVIIGGSPFVLDTRNQYSDVYITKATQYVYEFMMGLGLDEVTYHEWYDEYEDLTGRNVVGEIVGSVHPDEIVLIVAHLDDMPESDYAPGADDNASGSVGVMTAAEYLSDYTFERTIRFIFFTGEEVNLCGSAAYAQEAKAEKENIVAVFNMDMIGWDANNDGAVSLETRYITNTGYTSDLAIVNVFTQVINAYGIGSLHPTIDAINDDAVDSWSFWSIDYPSVTAIEDFGGKEKSPYYHTVSDTLSTLNLPYFTAFVKASVGTAAHLATIIDAAAATQTPTPIAPTHTPTVVAPTITPTPIKLFLPQFWKN